MHRPGRAAGPGARYENRRPKSEPSPSKSLKQRLVLRRADDQDIADASKHERCQRIVDHRLVENRQQLFRDDRRDRVKPGPRTARQNDTLSSTTDPRFPRRLSTAEIPTSAAVQGLEFYAEPSPCLIYSQRRVNRTRHVLACRVSRKCHESSRNRNPWRADH